MTLQTLARHMKDYLVEKSKKETFFLKNTIRCLEDDKLKKEEEIIKSNMIPV